MRPDFSKKTIETLAKRAAFKCSNPDCRVATVGPNEDVNKSTLIGEAAHICGARSGAKRYVADMKDVARAEITNALWLCRNCHKIIDSDDKRYTANLLFFWRNLHEEFVLTELGNTTDQIILEENHAKVEAFSSYPPIIKRIIIDEPAGWEWRLASELLQHLNKPKFRTLENLRHNLYAKPLIQIKEELFLGWVRLKFAEMQNLMRPFEGLLPRLSLSFGALGEKGDIEEIHHICNLISDYIEQVIIFEESVYFVHVPDECVDMVNLLKDCIGSQALKLAEIPDSLNDVVAKATSGEYESLEKPEIISKVIEIVLPDGWTSKVDLELQKIQQFLS